MFKTGSTFLIGLGCLFSPRAFAAKIPVIGGYYLPIIGGKEKKFVKNFSIDQTAVTNGNFADFVSKNPRWRRGAVPSLFADSKYLAHWKTPGDAGDVSISHSPVVNVSWFAAKAYCDADGSTLPTVDQWEYLAQFGDADSTRDVEAAILEWYSKPNSDHTRNVRSTFKNKFGVWDVHGLIWEWTYDFNTTFITGESRGDSALEKSMFCGSGGASSADPSKYSAFMRFGFRSSLQANYSVENLGFRCVTRQGKI